MKLNKFPIVGNALKILVDECKVTCIATGSSSFELMQAVGEPLTGRKQTILLYPVSQLELDAKGFEIKEVTLVADSVTKPLQYTYDGKKIHLDGEVFIEHHFGLISCDKADLLLSTAQPERESKNLTPEKILLCGHVQIELQDGSHLTANEADINCLDLEGYFTAIDPDKVVYTTYFSEGGNKMPVITSSRAMRLKMKKEEGSSQYVFSDMQGEGAVSIEYLHSEASK